MMAHRRSTVIAGATVIVVAAGVYFARDTLLQRLGFGGTGSGVAPPPAVAAEQSVELPESLAASVKVQAVEEREFPLEKEAIGSIDFNEDMTLQVFASNPGRIIDLYVKISDEVKKGQTLYTIDSPDLVQAASTLITTAGVLELTTRTLIRLRDLAKTKAVPQKDLEQAISDQQAAEGAYKAARDAVRIFGKTEAEMDRMVADRHVDPALVVPSPISGRITARNAAPGLFVQPGNAPAPYAVADISTMWMLANVHETVSPQFKVGQEVKARVLAYADRVFEGKVTTLGPSVDPNTHRVLVRSEIADPDHLLRPGMFATFVIRVGDPVRAAAVPADGVEMERYYTIPMEVGLAPTPGVDKIRSTSFYGLAFVRVMFNYGVDYYFAYTQAALSLQQRVSLPNVQANIQGSSLVGEIFRYQVVGPEHFGLSNLRTVQDWILQRRLLTVPGVIQVNTWGGTTKEYEVEVDLHKLDAYNITLPQVISAIGNANNNVGGRQIRIGEQSVNIRGVGLIDSGGTNDLTQGWKVEDIENIVLTQINGVPVLVSDIAKVYVGHVPRLGRAGRDKDEDVVAAIVVMNRTLHTNDVLARVKAEVAKINSDGTLPPGVKLVPYYDRGSLVSVTTATVMHNLIFGCLLVFLIQWTFLGNLRSAVIVGANIPFALFFSIIILVLLGEDANLLSMGAVDFGIIVDSAVILVENIFRNFQAGEPEKRRVMDELAAEVPATRTWTERLRLIFASALQVDKAILFSTAVTIAAFVPLFTMQGVEGQIFNPMARTYGYALVGALISTFTITPVLASLLLPEHVEEAETCARFAPSISLFCARRCRYAGSPWCSGWPSSPLPAP
jgi:RND family efflux transporter MFP subunit